MNNIEYLIEKILVRNQKQTGEDEEYGKYLKKIFSGYKSREATADLIYETVMSNKLKYWFDVHQKIIWKPIFHNFNGVYIIEKDSLLNKLPIHSYRNDFVQNNRSTPLEWMAVRLTYGADDYGDRFYSRLSDMFYRISSKQSEKEMQKIKFFERTLIPALDLSLSLFDETLIEKIEFNH